MDIAKFKEIVEAEFPAHMAPSEMSSTTGEEATYVLRVGRTQYRITAFAFTTRITRSYIKVFTCERPITTLWDKLTGNLSMYGPLMTLHSGPMTHAGYRSAVKAIWADLLD